METNDFESEKSAAVESSALRTAVSCALSFALGAGSTLIAVKVANKLPEIVAAARAKAEESVEKSSEN